MTATPPPTALLFLFGLLICFAIPAIRAVLNPIILIDDALRIPNGELVHIHQVKQFLFEKYAWTTDKVVLKDASVVDLRVTNMPDNRDKLEAWLRKGTQQVDTGKADPISDKLGSGSRL